jgi:hypothetical protein
MHCVPWLSGNQKGDFMSKQKVTLNITNNEPAASYFLDELLIGGFSVVAEFGGDVWHITGEREFPDGDPDDDIRAGHTLN